MFYIHSWVLCSLFMLFPTLVELRGVPSIRQLETNIRYKIVDTLPSAPLTSPSMGLTEGERPPLRFETRRRLTTNGPLPTIKPKIRITTKGKIETMRFEPSLASFSSNRQEYHWEHEEIHENDEIECSQSFEELQHDFVMDDPATNSTTDADINRTGISTDSPLSNFMFPDGSKPSLISWNCKKLTQQCCEFSCCEVELSVFWSRIFMLGHVFAMLLMFLCVCIPLFFIFRKFYRSRNAGNINEDSNSYPMSSQDSQTDNDNATIITTSNNNNEQNSQQNVYPMPYTVVFQQNYIEDTDETVGAPYETQSLIPCQIPENVAEDDEQPLLGSEADNEEC